MKQLIFLNDVLSEKMLISHLFFLIFHIYFTFFYYGKGENLFKLKHEITQNEYRCSYGRFNLRQKYIVVLCSVCIIYKS